MKREIDRLDTAWKLYLTASVNYDYYKGRLAAYQDGDTGLLVDRVEKDFDEAVEAFNDAGKNLLNIRAELGLGAQQND